MMSNSTLPPQQVQEILILLATGGFSTPERKAISFLKSFISTVSVIGASLLIHIVLRKHRKNRSDDTPTFHRFLLGVSIYDVLYEIWSAIGVVAVPRTSIGYGAIGTRGTCTAQGFFFTLSIGSYIYNAGLSIYYILVIRYGVTEKTIAKYLEPTLHLLALTVPLAFGIHGLCSKMYNPPVFAPQESGCFAYPYPPICVLTGLDSCERGRHSTRWMNAFYGTELLFIVIVVVMSAVLYWTVRTQYRSSSRYASRETEQMKQRVRAVACQAFLFAFACVYTGFWGCIALAAVRFQLPWKIPLKVVTFNFAAATSSQGFLNFVIYTRPRYNRLRTRRPEVGRWGALMIVIFGERTHVNDDRHQSFSSALNKLFTRRRSTAQPSSQTVVTERRPSLWMSSSMFGATNVENTTLNRGRWETLMSAMFGEDNGRAPRRNSLVVLFRRRSTIDTSRRQPDSSDATMADSGPQRSQGTDQCSPISVSDASVARNNDGLAITSMCDTDAEHAKMGHSLTEKEKLQHNAVRVSHDNDGEHLVYADFSVTGPEVDCESVTLNLDVSESDCGDPPVVDSHLSSPVKE